MPVHGRRGRATPSGTPSGARNRAGTRPPRGGPLRRAGYPDPPACRRLPASDSARGVPAPRPPSRHRDRPAEPDLLVAGRRHDRPRRGGRRRRPCVLGRGPDLAQRRGPVPPDRPIPAVRLRPVDAAAVRAVGAPAVGRRLGRVARRDDPAAALDRALGLPAPAAHDRGHRRAPRLPGRGEPRHGQHQPPPDPDAVGRPVHRTTAGRSPLGPRDLDEVGAPVLLGRPGAQGPCAGAGLVVPGGPVEHRPAAADDPAVPGPVRVRGAPDPAGLPGLPLGVRPVAVPERSQGRAGATTGALRARFPAAQETIGSG